MKERLKALVLACMAIMTWMAVSATPDVAISLYNRWERLPSEQLMKMGERYRVVSRQPDSALVCFSIVANRYYQGHQSRDDIEKAIEAMTHIAWLYHEDFYDYTKSVSYNLQAKELAEKHQCLDYMPFILINEADIQRLTESFSLDVKFSEKALKIHKEAFHMALKQKNWHAAHVAFFDMMIETTFNDKESMIEQEMDILMSDAIPDTIVNTRYARCLIQGVRAWNNGQPDSSLTHFKHLLDIAEQQQSPGQKRNSLLVAYYYISFWYLAHDQLEKCIEVQHTIEQLSKEYNKASSLLSAYHNLSQYYGALHNEEMARHYHTLFLEGKDELINKRKLGSANEAQFLYELNKKNEEVREMARRDQMKNRMLWGALAFSVLLLIALALLWVNNRRIKERNRQLYNKSLEMLRADEEKHELIELLQSQNMPVGEVSPYAPADPPQREGKLGAARQSDLLHRIFYIMETSDEIFSPDFSLPRLAELVGDTRNNVSEAINLRYQGNFNALVNEYRIKEACRRFNDRANYGQLTIEAVGQSVGFKSRSAFSSIFKQITGLTPGAYQRQSK